MNTVLDREHIACFANILYSDTCLVPQLVNPLYRKYQKKLTDGMFLFLDREQQCHLEALYSIISKSSHTQSVC